MLDLQCFNRALKAKWIQRYLDPHNRGKWKLFVEFSLIGHDINLLLQGNLNSDDVASLGIEDPFTKELIETWSLLNLKKKKLSNFGITPIWYNSLIRIDNKPIHYRNWSTVGIYFVNDLLEEDSQFLTFDTFKEKFAIKGFICVYYLCLRARKLRYCIQHEFFQSLTCFKIAVSLCVWCLTVSFRGHVEGEGAST